jgi:hypothetical protein
VADVAPPVTAPRPATEETAVVDADVDAVPIGAVAVASATPEADKVVLLVAVMILVIVVVVFLVLTVVAVVLVAAVILVLVVVVVVVPKASVGSLLPFSAARLTWSLALSVSGAVGSHSNKDIRTTPSWEQVVESDVSEETKVS